MNRVSVLIPLHNCESTVRRALMSVKNQTYQDFEVIAVNNNCTDNTIEIVKEFVDDMTIKIVDCEIPGIVPALNRGLKHCHLEFVARQDGDDFWYPEKLEKQIQFMDDNPKVGVLGTQIQLLDEDGNSQKLGTMGREVRYPTTDDTIKTFLLHGQNSICHPSVVVKNEILQIVGGYEMLFPKAEDLHLWLRMLPHTNFSNLEEKLIDYTQRKDDDYDARVPILASDAYFNLYKRAGLITGERQNRVWDWQANPEAHGNKKV
jgi:glycosyltransferase involved in cell wall biosynthesis